MSGQKIVKFNGTVKVRRVNSVDSLTREERQNVWFSTDDLNAIRNREKQLAKKLSSSKKKSKNLRNTLMNEIGLESKVDKMERTNRIQNGKYSVLLEQERQWINKEKPDPEKLARVSSSVSQESLTKAHHRAMNVQQQVLLSSSVFSLGSSQNRKSMLLRGRSGAPGGFTTKFMPNATGSPISNARWRQESSSKGSGMLSPPIRRTSVKKSVPPSRRTSVKKSVL